MMLVKNQKIPVRWNNRSKRHYIDLGYVYTKNGDTIYVSPEELVDGCHTKVEVVCDYCGKHIMKEWREYLNGCLSGKDCCSNCQPKKNEDGIVEKYGVSNVFQLEEIKQKSRDTLTERFGAFTNVAYIPEIQKKIKQTNIERYGVEYSTQSDTMKQKSRQTLYKHGTTPTSAKEQKVISMLKSIYGEDACVAGYPVGNASMDCLITVYGCEIDVEYDGWYWHKDRAEHDKRRDYWLVKQGYKILRIKPISKNARELPTIEEIVSAVDYLVKGNHSHKNIELI